MIQTFRQIYFNLQKENNPYLSEAVIKEYLCFVGKYADFTDFFMHLDEEIDFDYDDEKLLQLREGKPIQQVTNCAYFCGHKLYVNEDVLIPRQETETLVALIKEKREKMFGEKPVDLLDLCCGSGAIGLALSNKHTNLTLSDISNKALEVAKKNASNIDGNIAFVESDLLQNVEGKFDIIVCNPPYIENEDNIDRQVYEYEPLLALIAKPGYIFYERILKDVSNYLKDRYIVGFEIEEDMENKLTELIKQYLPNSHFSFYKDICDKTRFVIIVSEV